MWLDNDFTSNRAEARMRKMSGDDTEKSEMKYNSIEIRNNKIEAHECRSFRIKDNAEESR